MAKKQIKELVILTKETGAKQATEGIKALELSMTNAAKASRSLNQELGGSVKVSKNVANAYAGIVTSMNNVVTASRNLSKSLNGDTKTAAKNLNAYIDNLQLVTLYMKDLATESEITAKNIGKIGMSGGAEMKAMVNFLEQIYLEMLELNESTKETIITLDRLGDRITDVEVQTKKGRIETERLNNAYNENTKAAGKAGKANDKLANDVRRLGGAGSQGARAFSSLAFQMNPLVSLYASIAVNVYAVTEAFRVLNEAANLERLRNQTAQFAATLSGIDIQALSANLQELSGGAISAGDALRQSVRGVSYGFMVEDMERLTTGARKASIALGVDFADAMDRAFRGISKGEVEILDEIGVVTRLDTAYKKYATTLGKSADALTEVERRQALTNEVIAQLEQRFSGVDIAASGFEALSVATKDATDSLLIMAATSLDGPAKSMANFLSGFSGVKSAAKEAEEAQKIYNKALADGRISQAAVALSEYEKALAKLKNEQTTGTKENDAYVKSLESAELAANLTTKAMTAAGLYMAYYAGTVLVSVAGAILTATTRTIAFTTAQIAAAAAGKAGTLATVAYTAATAGFSAALAVARVATLALSGAALKAAASFLIFLAPIALVVAKVVAVAAVVGILVYEIGKFVDMITGGMVSDAIAKVGEWFDWLGQKFKDFLSFIGKEALAAGKSVVNGIGDGLDAVSSGLGLDKKMAELFNIPDESIKAISKEQVDTYIAELNRGLQGSSVSFAPELGGLDGTSMPNLGIDRAQAEANLSYMNSLKSSLQTIGEEFNNLKKYETSFGKLASAVGSLAGKPISLSVDSRAMEEVRAEFENLKQTGVIPLTIKWDNGAGLKAFNNEVQIAARAIEEYDRRGAFMLESFSAAVDQTDPAANIMIARRELELVNKVLDAQKGLSAEVNSIQRQALADKKAILELQTAQMERDLRIQQAMQKEELILASAMAMEQTREHTQESLIELELNSLEAKKRVLETEGRNTNAIEHQIALMRIRLGLAKEELAIAVKGLEIDNKVAEQERRVSNAIDNKARVLEMNELIKLKQQQIDQETDLIEKTRMQLELERMKTQNSRDTAAAPYADAGAAMSSIAGLSGLTDMQSSFASTLGSMSTSYSEFLSSASDQSMTFAQFLAQDLESLSNVGSSALAMASSIFQQISSSKIESIDQEIAAEQRRDGKSAESLAKLKKLNAKKIKEEAKAKKASVGMSTAMAIMQSYAQLGPIAGSFAAVAMAAMGILQMASIDKAAAGQMAAINDGGGQKLSLSGGNRDNAIDVSKAANAGELAYLQGAQGMGSAQNFTPGRAGGNMARAGTGIVVGESGPEVIVPQMPSYIQPAGAGGGNNITYAPVYNNQAIDSNGMEELMMRHSKLVYQGLESELNANNMTLESLRG